MYLDYIKNVGGEVYSIQHYVIKFVCDLRQVGDFLWFLPPIKLKVVLDTIKPTNLSFYVNEVNVLHSFHENFQNKG
jgi:hypothetical protein